MQGAHMVKEPLCMSSFYQMIRIDRRQTVGYPNEASSEKYILRGLGSAVRDRHTGCWMVFPRLPRKFTTDPVFVFSHRWELRCSIINIIRHQTWLPAGAEQRALHVTGQLCMPAAEVLRSAIDILEGRGNTEKMIAEMAVTREKQKS